MNVVFYISGAVAVVTTAVAITRRNAAHALLYLVLSLISVALVFFTLGAPFAAALEVIIYAGAIMVLFLFVIMMLNPAAGERSGDGVLGNWKTWIAPAILSAVLGTELIYLLAGNAAGTTDPGEVVPSLVGVALLGPYVLGVELASLLLMAALVAAFHFGRRAVAGEEDEPQGRGGG